MNAYEEMKNQILLNLTDRTQLTAEEIRKVISEIDRAAAGYEITKKPTEIILPEEAAPRLVRQYIACKMMQGMSELTTENYKRTLVQFFRYVKKPPEQVEANDIRMYLYDYQTRPGKTVSQATVNNYLRYIKYFFSWCQDSDLISRNPAKTVGSIKCEQKHRNAMSRRDLILLMNACRTEKERAIINVFFATGCRISEAVGMKTEDIDWRKKTIHVFGKGKKHRDVFFNDAAEIAMREYLEKRKQKSPYLFASDRENENGRRMTTAGMRAAIKRICESAGTGEMSVHVTPHVIRHTTATLALDAGMPVEQVQLMLGHSQIETTMKYIDVNRSAVMDSYRRHVI
ncbi:MAG: tyrosine-type recombinase/integrase [Lachnospiraceae bacterium]|nr:tyrosine-type recombinase/integrase [Lachnospiraceae bacterium]